MNSTYFDSAHFIAKLEQLDQSITGIVVNLWDAIDAHKEIPQDLRAELTVVQHRLL